MSLLPFQERYNLVEVPEDYDYHNPDFVVMKDMKKRPEASNHSRTLLIYFAV
ncbi:hypothetical protein [Jeotgalibacillus malaysiensis]|uniref:hypothetical protein n=1 Tax=Jeotgalibacillus malaysiensis TaxID=1508404 RepID=UPI00384B988E